MGDYGGAGRKNQYFVPGDGIAREVITSDICKYLDNDATVRPANYQVRLAPFHGGIVLTRARAAMAT